jgi:drug/metabolite transporter (DMT)-like permease
MGTLDWAPWATILLARFLHGERLVRVQQYGVAAALAGVALIGAGGTG